MLKKQSVENVSGFKVYAPNLVAKSESFKSGAHDSLAQYEDTYFWFSERRKLICFLLKKHFPEMKSFCEVGCGGGNVLAAIKQCFPATKIAGSEIFIDGLKIARTRLPDTNLFQADLLDFPYLNEFDVIGAFDVIEHIKDDQQAISSIYEALTPNGGAIISVPQHKWLWSQNDIDACHQRRYTKKELVEKCQRAGFSVRCATSYTSLLLPAFMLNCLLNKTQRSSSSQFSIPPLANIIFKAVTSCERFLIKKGVHFSFGGSLILVLKKANSIGS